MQSRLFINLLLLIIIVGVTLFLFLTEQTPEDPAPQSISQIDPQGINEIVIQRQAREPIRFSRQAGPWQMISPYRVAANPQRIDALLKLLAAQSAAQLPLAEVEPGRLLLADPEITLRLNDEVFAFGDTNPLDKKRYVLYRDTVHLVHDNLYPQLTAGPTFFISTRVLPEQAEIAMVQYPHMRLVQQQAGDWRLESGLDIKQDEVLALSRAWQELTASTVQAYQSQPALYEIAVQLQTGDSLHFQVVSDLPELILARTDLGLQYHIPPYSSEKLFPGGPDTE